MRQYAFAIKSAGSQRSRPMACSVWNHRPNEPAKLSEFLIGGRAMRTSIPVRFAVNARIAGCVSATHLAFGVWLGWPYEEKTHDSLATLFQTHGC